MGDAAHGHVQADLEHQFLETLAVLATLDGVGLGADHFHTVLFQNAGSEKLHRSVEAGLPAERGEQSKLTFGPERLHLGQFAHDNFLNRFGRDRLDVGAVGKFRIGHNRGRIGIHQHHAIAFLLERLTGLRARIIKLTRLPNNNRASADNQNRMNVVSSRHEPRET